MAVVINVVGKTNVRDLDKVSGELQKMRKSAESSSSRMGRALGKIGAAAKRAVKAAAFAAPVLAAGAVAVGKHVLDTGAKLEDLDKKAAAVFEGSLPGVRNWAKENAGAMGLTATELTGLTANFADLLKPMGFTAKQAAGMAQETNELSGALAKWSGGTRSAAEVSQILGKAMLGERESLKELGISITEADVKTRLAANGAAELTGKALEQAKAIATQQLIMEKSTDAQEAWADGQDDLSVKMNRLRAFIGELREKAIRTLLPHVVRIAETMGEWGQRIARDLQPKVEALGAWWQTNGPRVIAQAKAIAATVQQVLAVAFAVLKGVFDRVVTAVQFVMRHWDKLKIAIGVAAAVMIPHFVALGAAAVVSSAKQAGAWVVAQAGAIKAAVVHSAQVARMVAKWALVGVQSLLHAGKVAAAWLIAMGPVALVIAAVVGLVALIIANWDKIVRFTRAMAEKVAAWFRRMRDQVVGKARELRDKVVGFVTNLRDRALGLAKALVRGYVNYLLWWRDRIIAVVRWVRDRFVAGVRFLKDRALGLVRALADGIRSRFDRIVGFIRGLPSRIASATRGMWDGIKNAFRNAVNFVIDGWNGLSFTLPAVDLPGPLNFEGMTLSTPNIPRLASGAIATDATLAMIGEGRQDEAVIPLPPGWRSQGSGPLGGNTFHGPLVELTIVAPAGADAREFARIARRELEAGLGKVLVEVAAGAGVA